MSLRGANHASPDGAGQGLSLGHPPPSPSTQRSATHGHHYSKSHSGLNSYTNPAAAGGAAPAGIAMDRSSSSSGLTPAGGTTTASSSSPSANALSPGAAGGGGNAASNSRFRASVDAARSLYPSSLAGSGGAQGLAFSTGSPSLGPPKSGTVKRPSSDMLTNSALAGLGGSGLNAENEAIDKWFEDLHHYEATLEEMAAASLDQSFKEELGAIEQWFRVLSEAERTAALYSLLQSSSQVQIRFFITVLQQMARSDPMTALLSPANPQQASMEAQMDAKLASLGLKSPASPALRQFARQSMGAAPTSDLSGFLSPSSAMLQAAGTASAARQSSLDDVHGSGANNNINGGSDAATLLAQQRAKLNAHAANRISAPGSLLSAHDHTSLRSPLWSQANSEQVAERSGRSPSPNARSNRSRPTSMISDHSGSASLLSGSNNNIMGSGSSATSASATAPAASANAGTSAANRNTTLDLNQNLANIAEAQLSPLLANPNWAAMMSTPLMSSFNGDGASGNADFGNSTSNWAASSYASNNSNIVLDDAKKFRRQGRASDAGLDAANASSGSVQGILSNMYDQSKRQNGSSQPPLQQQPSSTLGSSNQAAALSAQQNWRNVNGLLNHAASPNLSQHGGLPGSPELGNLANLQAAMQGMSSPQIAMANLLAAQQQIQQQMQLQQNLNMLNSMGMSPMGVLGMNNQLQNQQMLSSPVLGGLGVGMFSAPHLSGSGNSNRDRRSPRPSDRSTFGGDKKAAPPIVPGCGTNPDEPVDMKLISDVPAWLRSLRLHKYTTNFETTDWRDMVVMDEAALEAKGVAALGARRKLLKVFENVRKHQNIPHPPGLEPRPASPTGNTTDTNPHDS